MRCPKCNAELTSEQKVCVKCGALTPASGYFYQDRKEFKLTKNMRLGLYVLGAIVLVLIVYKIFHITPPQTVAQEWLNALATRQTKLAGSFVTEEYKTTIADRFSDLREISDNLYMDMSDTGSTIEVSTPEIRSMAPYDKALITVSLIQQGQVVKQMHMELVLQGRKWKVNDFY